MTSSNTSIKGWKIVFIILGVILIVFGLVIFNWNAFMILIGSGESYSTVYLYELNESVVPQGIIISLTEEDFKEFRQLASVIRDKNKKPIQILDDGKRLYTIPLTTEEYYTYIDHYWFNNSRGDVSGRFFEFKGKYYDYSYPHIH